VAAPQVPNIFAPVAAILIDPANGTPYALGNSDIASVVQIPNIFAPIAVVPLDPTTGVGYVI